MNDYWPVITRRIETYVDEIVSFQAELVACPAIGPQNGGQGEAAKSLIARKWLERLNPDELVECHAPDPSVPGGWRPNLAARFKGRGQGTVWVLSHLDIVPAGEISLWSSDPFTLKREGDRIFGRGVEDNHQGLVSSYFAMKAFRDEAVAPALSVGLIFVSDEETGSKFGLRHLLSERPDLFSPQDLIIVPDAGNRTGTMIEVSEKSTLWLKFTVTGKQCHASTPGLGINTLRASARIITEVDQALHAAFTAADALFAPPSSTMEPTKKEANVPNINTVPGEDIFYFDCRILPQYDPDEVIVVAEEAAQKAAAELGAKVNVQAISREKAPEPTSPDAPVVLALKRAVAEVHHREARPMGIGGATVAAFFRRKGLPAAVWSTVEAHAHAPDESCLLSNILADAKVFAHVYLGL